MAEVAGNREAALRVLPVLLVAHLPSSAPQPSWSAPPSSTPSPSARHLQLTTPSASPTPSGSSSISASPSCSDSSSSSSSPPTGPSAATPTAAWSKNIMTLGAFAAMHDPRLPRRRRPLTSPWSSPAPIALGTLIFCIMVARYPLDRVRLPARLLRRDPPHRPPRPRLHGISPSAMPSASREPCMAVGYALGPTAVVIFSTARTVSRVALQMVQMVNNTFEPEIVPLLRSRQHPTHAPLAPPSRLSAGPHRRCRHRPQHDHLRPLVPPSLDRRPRPAQPSAARASCSSWSSSPTRSGPPRRHPDDLDQPAPAPRRLVHRRHQHHRLHHCYLWRQALRPLRSRRLVPAHLRDRHEPLRRPYLRSVSRRTHLPAFLASHAPRTLTSLRPDLALLARVRRSKPGFES